MPIVPPSNIETISPPSSGIKTNKRWHEHFFEHANPVVNIIFMLLELIIGVAIFAQLLLYGWNIFHKWDSTYIEHARYIIKSIHKYWIGVSFIFALIFFRVILLKLSKLRNVKSGTFDKGVKIYSTEGE